jgi:proline racemase
VIFYEDQGYDETGTLRQRNVTVFADGEVDRSPCGSGTAARVAVLAASGDLAEGRHLRHESIVGSVFLARVSDITSAEGPCGPVPAVVPVITGSAYQTGEHMFVVDPDDPITPGFVLR